MDYISNDTKEPTGEPHDKYYVYDVDTGYLLYPHEPQVTNTIPKEDWTFILMRGMTLNLIPISTTKFDSDDEEVVSFTSIMEFITP